MILRYVLFILLLNVILLIIPAHANNLQVTFINVGQGDSSLIQLPDNQTILIDGGDKDASVKVEKVLKDKKINKIDIMIITHPHLDHYGGLLNIAKKFKIYQVLDSGAKTNAITYLELLKILNSKKVKFKIARKGDIFNFDNNISLEIISPKEPLLKGTRSDINNSSIVAKLKYNKIAFLFTGDIENEIEEQILKDNINIKSNILKVAHHGSRHSSSETFLNKVAPEIAIISCGSNNSYKHPHKQLINRLKKFNIKYYRTDLNGDVIVNTDGNNYNIFSKKSIENDLNKFEKEITLININTATLEELVALPGIGEKTAIDIIKNRPYYSVEDLLKIKGINKNKFRLFEKMVTAQ